MRVLALLSLTTAMINGLTVCDLARGRCAGEPVFICQFDEGGAALSACLREDGRDFVSHRAQNFAVATPRFALDHLRTNLAFAVIVGRPDLWIVRGQQPVVRMVMRSLDPTVNGSNIIL